MQRAALSTVALSVVIPSHDTRELTLRCLTSLAAATHRTDDSPTEILLVDDGSRDGTSAAVRASHPNVTLITSPDPTGFTAAANRGLAAASGELLLLLNSDTEVDPNALPAVRDAFASRPRLGVAGAVLRYPDGTPQWNGGALPTIAWLFALASAWPALAAALPLWRRLRPARRGGDVAWVTGAALATRRATWSAVGPLDESFRFYGQDVDYCTRATALGWDVAVAEGFTVMHHHGASIGQKPGARARRENTELLWHDLLRWGELHRGAAWTRRARRALALGGRLRLTAARLARRPESDVEALRRALASLRPTTPARRSPASSTAPHSARGRS